MPKGPDEGMVHHKRLLADGSPAPFRKMPFNSRAVLEEGDGLSIEGAKRMEAMLAGIRARVAAGTATEREKDVLESFDGREK